MKNKTRTLDVREDIQQGREPFSKIMAAVQSLEADEDLLLIAPFKPAPLFGVLAQRGFVADAVETASGDWEVRFTRADENPSPPPRELAVPKGRACSGGPVVDVDARGLEPPQPLVVILEALSTLPPGGSLRAITERRPMHLYSQLEERGFTGETTEQADGSFVTQIRAR